MHKHINWCNKFLLHCLFNTLIKQNNNLFVMHLISKPISHQELETIAMDTSSLMSTAINNEINKKAVIG